MKFGSLFSGVGGFDAGFEAASMECIWQVELDGDCNRVLERHWADVKRFTDVKETGRHNLKPVDLICGGFPCQDLSVAGKREGLAGERSGLWFEFHRILAGIRPRWCVIENVPGLLSSLEGGDFAIILRGLVELGYGVAYRVLDAQYFGVAQRRRRVFIVGSLGDGRAAQVLFESESLSRNPAESREARARTTGTVTPGIDGNRRGWAPMTEADSLIAVPDIAYALGAAEGGRFGSGRDAQDTFVAHALRSEGADASEDGSGRGTPLVVGPIGNASGKRGWKVSAEDAGGGHIVSAPIAQSNRGNATGGLAETVRADSHGALPMIAFTSKGSGADAGELAPTLRSMNYDESHINGGGQIAVAFESRFARNGRGAPESIVPPLKAESGQTNKGDSAPLMAGSFGVRRLTPRECERLMKFPDDWTRWDAQGKEISDSARYRMLGNSIVTSVAEWIGRRIMEADSA